MKNSKQDSFKLSSQIQDRLYNYPGQPSRALQKKIRYYITPYNRKFRKQYMNFDVIEDELCPLDIDCSCPPTITQLQANRNWKIISDFILHQQKQGISIKPTTFVKDHKSKRSQKWYEGEAEKASWRKKCMMEVICYNDMYCFMRKLKNHNPDEIPLKENLENQKQKHKRAHSKRKEVEWKINCYKKRLTRHEQCKSIKDNADLLLFESRTIKEDHNKIALSPIPTLKQWIDNEK